MIRAGSTLRFLDKLAASTVKKSALDDELIVIEWKTSGSVLMHLDVSGVPKIKRFVHLRFDDSTTETDKRNAHQQFLELVGSKKYPKAVLCWSDGMTFRQLQLPDMPREDLLKAFAWDLKKKYYFNAEENLFAYKEVMAVDGEEGPEKLYDIFYCENKVALPRLDFALSLGLEIQALVPTQAALAFFSAAQAPPPDKDVLVCEIAESSARILVAHGDLDLLTRNVSLGNVDGPLNDETLARLADEIRKTIDYHESQPHARAIGKVLFCGEGVQPNRLLDFMTPRLGLPVAVPDLSAFTSPALDENEKNLAASDPGLFTAALGASMMADDSLNLVPEDIKSKNQRRKFDRWLNLGLIGLGAILFVVVLATTLNLQWAESRLSTLKKEYSALSENQKVLEDLLGRSRVRRTALGGDIPMHALLKELSLRTPAVLVFSELRFNRQDDTLVLIGDLLDAKRESAKTVNQFATSLSESIFFESATVQNTTQDESGETLRFQIEGVVKGLST